MTVKSVVPRRHEPLVREPGPDLTTAAAPPGKPDAYTRARPPQRGQRRASRLRAAFDAIPVPAVQADVRLLEHNRESWTAFWSVVTQPGGVDASYFIVERDIFGFAFLGALLKKARAKEQVRFMVDATGEFGASGFARKIHGQEYLQELVRSGVDARVYHPIYKKLLKAPLRLLRAWWKGEPAFSVIANDHQKVLRNPRMGITGGRNVSRDYFTPPEDRGDVFHDSDVLVVGERGSAAMERAFLRELDDTDLQHPIRVDGFGDARRREVELLGAFHLMDRWMKMPATAEEQARLREEPVLRSQAANALVAHALDRLAEEDVALPPTSAAMERLLSMAWELCGYPGLRGASLGFSPKEELHTQVDVKLLSKTSAANRDPTNDFAAALPGLIRGAERKITIRSAYLVLTHEIIEALKEAGERGVKIEILTNGPQSTDSTWTQADFLSNWPGLLAEVPNLRLRVLTTARKLHCKDACIDDVLCLVGSYNLDITSEQINAEMAALVWSKGLAAQLGQSYDEDVDPEAHRSVEYTILRDALGQPIRRDGRPVVTYGAKDHLPPEEWRTYQRTMRRVQLIRMIPFVSALRHPALDLKK